MDEEGKRARLSLLGPEILTGLQQPEENDPNHLTKWRPEYASYMIEGERGRGRGREGERGKEGGEKVVGIRNEHLACMRSEGYSSCCVCVKAQPMVIWCSVFL